MAKPITIPTEHDQLKLLKETIDDIENIASGLNRSTSTYDKIIALRVLKKQVNKTLKALNN
jgi:hypothetical protein